MKNIHLLAVIMTITALMLVCPSTATSQPGLDKDWETIVTKAKQEGKVSVYSLWSPKTRETLGKAFAKKYGIAVEFTTFSRGGELLAKVQTEQRAGLYLADAFGAGAPSLVATMKPVGLLGAIEHLLVLPEVKDPKLWRNGKLPFLDRDKRAIGMITSIQRHLIYNANMVKQGEIATYKDVLKTKFKGSITLVDPSVAGAGNSLFAHLAHDLWNTDEAIDFLKKLIRQQHVDIRRDGRIHVESVAKGKYAIGLAPAGDLVYDFIANGAPLAIVLVKEGTFVSVGSGALAIPTRFANPNAAKVFLNWILSKDGQKAFTDGYGFPSARTDVSTEGMNPAFIPQPGEKLFQDSEEQIIFRSKMRGIVKKAMDEASRP